MRHHSSLLARTLVGAALSIPLAGSPAAAGPTDPVVISAPPMGQGAAFVPGTRLLSDLPVPYVEEELFVAGESTLFNYAHDPPLGPTDIEPIQTGVPYRTRIIVRRPVSQGRFNGSVVIEWWNSTAGFDTAPAWDASAEHFAREGYVYVGVTNSTTALDFLAGGCRVFNILPPTCGTRYATLSMPENGLAFEMVSQLANHLKSGAAGVLPASFAVERLYHVGQSQQGGSIITYASAFHFAANDGYFVQQAATARDINFGTPCDDPAAPPFPDCTPSLQGADRLVRSDLPVPVYHVNSETDIDILFGTVGRQPDTPTFRYYEVAGAGHLTVHDDVEIVPAGVLSPDPIFLADLCEFEINSTADGPVFLSYVLNALWEAMEQQVQRGQAPPDGSLMQVDAVSDEVLRDAFGNGLGGVRLPAMEVPVATYVPGNQADPSLPGLLVFIGNLACRLASSVVPFDDETLDALYPSHGAYVNEVMRAASDLARQRLLLPADAQRIRDAAARSTIGCGIGFELVLVLPPLLWLRARRRRSGATSR